MKPSRLLPSLLAVLCVFLLVPSADAQLTVSSVSVSPVGPIVPKGRVQNFRATARMSNGTTVYVTNLATWNSLNTSIATIGGQSGGPGASTFQQAVNTVGVGTVTITATYQGKTGSTSLKVTAPVVELITVSPPSQSLAVGGTQQFTAMARYTDYPTNPEQDVTNLASWSSSNATVASVTNTTGARGLVTGKVNGTATLTATVGTARGTAALSVGTGVNGRLLTVSVVGAAGGTVTSNEDGSPDINCGQGNTLCANTFPASPNVTLTATPISGGSFVGWSGACLGSNPNCSISMTTAKTVTATFRLPLTIEKTGTGGGKVTSSPAGLSCGATCTGNFNVGALVALSATPLTGSRFVGWSGACSTTPCSVVMSEPRTVSAQFDVITYPLNVSVVGNGSGFVTSDTLGNSGHMIDCEDYSCSETYNHGTLVTLRAYRAPDSRFVNWVGCASTTTECTVTMTAARNVSANFEPLDEEPVARFAYAANRFHDTITGYNVAANGMLSDAGMIDLVGETECNDIIDNMPKDIVVDPTGSFVYVAISKHMVCTGDMEGQLLAYTIDALDGSLHAIGAPIALGDTSFGYDVAMDPRGRFVYVVAKGCRNCGANGASEVSAFYIETDGSLTLSDTVELETVQSMVAHPSGEWMLISHEESGGSVSSFAVDPLSGALTEVDTEEGLFSIHTMAIDHSGSHVYTGNTWMGNNRIDSYDFDPETGDLTVANSTSTGAGVRTLAAHPSADFLYASLRGCCQGNTVVYSIDPESGDLTEVMRIGSDGSADLDIDTAGHWLYTSHRSRGGSGRVGQYSIDVNGGANHLTFVQQVPVPSPASFAIALGAPAPPVVPSLAGTGTTASSAVIGPKAMPTGPLVPESVRKKRIGPEM